MDSNFIRAYIERNGLLAFVEKFWHEAGEAIELIVEPHMVLICKHLEACAINGTRQLKPETKNLAWVRAVPEPIDYLVIAIPPGMSQPHSEPVLLERGWVGMGDVRVGDRIYGSDGKLHAVTALHPQGPRKVWELEFSDGTKVRCDGDHLWTLKNRNGTVRTKTAREWAGYPLKKTNGGAMASTLFAPMVSPIQRPEADLPLDPYTLGLLLGDGSFTAGQSANFTSADPELVDALVLPVGLKKTTYSKPGTTAVMVSLTTERGQENGLLDALEHLGLRGKNSHTKFIPRMYLSGSIDQRLALLRGILDTDGTQVGSSARITVASKALADGVAELVESLGGTASRQEPNGFYSVYINLEQNPFKLARKADSFTKAAHQRKPYRAVVAIHETEALEECSCITVSAEDSLYVTKHHVVTHNSKSKIVSVFFPAWVWTWCPGAKFITTSYADDLAIDFGRQAYDVMRSEKYRSAWPGMEIEEGDRAAMSDYRNSKGGRRWSMPMGGKVTGKHGHFLLSDDPVKPDDLKLGGDSAREALNQTKYRWDALFSNRSAHPPTFTRIVIAQRLHSEDLSGHAIKQGAIHLRLPMLFEPHDAYESVWGNDWRSGEGELLAPERFPQNVVDMRQLITPARDFAAQYQQRPSPEGGAHFQREWFLNRYTGTPWGQAPIMLSVDASHKETKKSDFFVLQAWARQRANYYLVDQVRARLGFTDQLTAILTMKAKWANVKTILIEEKANGAALVNALKKNVPGVIAIEPDGGKESRAASTTWLWKSGCIWLPANAGWLGDYVEEHITFPVGSYDDQVDCTSQLLNWASAKDKHTLFLQAMAVQGKKMNSLDWLL